jgi:hypothetical protein
LRHPDATGGPITSQDLANRKAMLTDDEIDALAREILTSVVHEILQWEHPPFTKCEVIKNGDLALTYEGTSADGNGSFICNYMPLDAVRKIIREAAFSESQIRTLPKFV